MSDDMQREAGLREAALREAYQREVRAGTARDRRECPSPEELQALADGSLPHDRRAVLLDHVFGCAHCTPEFTLLRAVETAGEPAVSTPVRRRWWSPTRVAVAATVLVAVGIGGPALQRSRTNSADPVSTRSAAPAPVLRDGDRTVDLVSPAGDASTGALGSLTWRRVDGADGYVVDVFDSAGTLLLTRTSSDTTVALDAADSTRLAASGVFDWMVTARRADGNERRSAMSRVRVAR